MTTNNMVSFYCLKYTFDYKIEHYILGRQRFPEDPLGKYVELQNMNMNLLNLKQG
jgi:hypothetical protein